MISKSGVLRNRLNETNYYCNEIKDIKSTIPKLELPENYEKELEDIVKKLDDVSNKTICHKIIDIISDMEKYKNILKKTNENNVREKDVPRDEKNVGEEDMLTDEKNVGEEDMLISVLKVIYLINKNENKISDFNRKLIDLISNDRVGLIEKILINTAYKSKIDKNKLITKYIHQNKTLNDANGASGNLNITINDENELYMVIDNERRIIRHIYNIANSLTPTNKTSINSLVRMIDELNPIIGETTMKTIFMKSKISPIIDEIKAALETNQPKTETNPISKLPGCIKNRFEDKINSLKIELMKSGIMDLINRNNMANEEKEKIRQKIDEWKRMKNEEIIKTVETSGSGVRTNSHLNDLSTHQHNQSPGYQKSGNEIEIVETSASGNVGKKDSHQNGLTTHQDNQAPQKTSPSTSQEHQDSQNMPIFSMWESPLIYEPNLPNSSTWQSSSIYQQNPHNLSMWQSPLVYEQNLLNQISSADTVDNWVMTGDD